MTDTEPFYVSGTSHRVGSAGSAQTCTTRSGFDVLVMTTGYGDYHVVIYRPDGRVAGCCEWKPYRSEVIEWWGKRRAKFPDDVHAALCHLLPFIGDES